MNFLLTADWHLDDNPQNEYRWEVFSKLTAAAFQHKVDHVFILGDMVDRRDRHSAEFVNRLIAALVELSSIVPVTISRGNHDTPLRGKAFWEFFYFLSDNLVYLAEPYEHSKNLLILPFSADPFHDWSDLELSKYKCIFLHATVTGALSENGRQLEGQKMPKLPRSAKLYSGDIHTPQDVKNLTYVGSPHPIKYGDMYPCRFLVIDDQSFDVVAEVPLSVQRKLMIDVRSLDELQLVDTNRGDRARIRLNLLNADIDKWGETEAQIKQWAQDRGVEIVSTDVSVDASREGRDVDLNLAPEQILRDFSTEEDVPQELLDLGLSFLQQVRA